MTVAKDDTAVHWMTVQGYKVAFLSPESDVLDSLLKCGYDDEFVGPRLPLIRGELGHIEGAIHFPIPRLDGFSFTTSPYLKSIPKPAVVTKNLQKGPKKHWRRW